jgi:micrococcal nuclease
MLDADLLNANAKTPKFTFKGTKCSAKCVHVYDGDTAHFVFRPFPQAEPRRFVCRMLGYNSAEIHGSTTEEKLKAIESREALSRMILGEVVTLDLDAYDKYGRILATVYHDNVNINRWMVDNGHGKEYFGKGEKLW